MRTELGRTEGRIWFAGEAVNESSLWHSCVHGAWHSGVNAAESVSKAFDVPVRIPSNFGLRAAQEAK
jgi:monoamine oxidase